ncbi:MAG: 2-amino-4-hydroxy-6-hydroxymethyldihydropteridine diphosphokinase [Chitinophagaceae bacterium]
MNKTFLLLGSNLGNRLKNLSLAADLISIQIGEITNVSGFYETQAWGNLKQPDYLNQVLETNSNLTPMEILQRSMEIENMLGRIRNKVWEPRIIDIEILFYNDQIIQKDRLKIPHPYLTDRKFALVPMAEIAPHWIHPVFHQSIKELLDSCKDILEVKRLTNLDFE